MKIRLSPSPGDGPAPEAPSAPSPPEPLELDVPAGENLSRALWLSGRLRPLPLCGGLGRCGRCRLRFPRGALPPLPAEEAVFSPRELAAGWRLACRRHVPEAARAVPLELELPREDFAPEAAALEIVPGRMAGRELALAVDLGTTSVHWRALALDGAEPGAAVAQGSFLNPQAGAGADVMSRLAAARAPRGRARLARLARDAVRRIADGLRASGGRVARVCLAANTAMTDIFLNRDVEGLCAAPYRAAHAGHETVRLPGLPPVYIPPLPAPFVGGDVSAGLAALLEARTPRPFVLADLGTSGELALVTARGKPLLASVPLGPALEGIGPECGQPAGPDVVTDFSLGPAGLEAHSPDGSSGPARGVSATGYLSLIDILLQWGLLDASGLFAGASPPSPLARGLAAGLRAERGRMRLHLPRGLWLAAADVEELLKVKAAFALALDALLAAAGTPPRDVAAFRLAGALGEHVRPDILERLGLVPAGLGPRIRAAGNAALDGAALLALRPEKGAALARLCAGARVLPLVEDPDFHHAYLRRMRFGA
ncbi:ASKHA domain-containing protein [uncultured Desulfovibrio sp.]|uniref:ASKHA domain-containing protein n=1 Tax=uncultured Desulfovibrio sp. TaxID=167968 RepID=UPI002627DFBA|nr:ASKHA domain-containing protein [uncultured Desulfovibrio sp.]